MKTLLLLLLMLTGTAAATVVGWSNDPFTELFDFNGTQLSAGAVGPGDGARLELGYFDLATVVNPFVGNWIVLTDGTIGDKGDRGDGRFVLSRSSINFIPGAPSPAEGTPLAIRFYDTRPAIPPHFFNTVSNEQGLWNWRNGANDIVQATLTSPGLVWEDGGASAFRTTIPVPVPEPSAVALMWAAMIVAAWQARPRPV